MCFPFLLYRDKYPLLLSDVKVFADAMVDAPVLTGVPGGVDYMLRFGEGVTDLLLLSSA